MWGKTDLFPVHKLNPLTCKNDQPFFAIMLVKTVSGKRLISMTAVQLSSFHFEYLISTSENIPASSSVQDQVLETVQNR